MKAYVAKNGNGRIIQGWIVREPFWNERRMTKQNGTTSNDDIVEVSLEEAFRAAASSPSGASGRTSLTSGAGRSDPSNTTTKP